VIQKYNCQCVMLYCDVPILHVYFACGTEVSLLSKYHIKSQLQEPIYLLNTMRAMPKMAELVRLIKSPLWVLIKTNCITFLSEHDWFCLTHLQNNTNRHQFNVCKISYATWLRLLSKFTNYAANCRVLTNVSRKLTNKYDWIFQCWLLT